MSPNPPMPRCASRSVRADSESAPRTTSFRRRARRCTGYAHIRHAISRTGSDTARLYMRMRGGGQAGGWNRSRSRWSWWYARKYTERASSVAWWLCATFLRLDSVWISASFAEFRGGVTLTT